MVGFGNASSFSLHKNQISANSDIAEPPPLGVCEKDYFRLSNRTVRAEGEDNQI